MQRRALLTTMGAGISVGMAGCLGGDDEGEIPEEVDTGWPYVDKSWKDEFKIVPIDVPEEITVREPFEVTVAFGNRYDEPKNLAATLKFEAADDYEGTRFYQGNDGMTTLIEQTEVGPGDVETVTQEFQAASVGKYVLTASGESGIAIMADDGYTKPRLRVQPQEGTTNETIDVTDQFRITPSVSFVNAFEYERSSFGSSEELVQRNTPPEQVIAVVSAHVENTGMESLDSDDELFRALDSGETITELSDGNLSSARLEGEPLTQLQLPEGDETTGWIAFVYDRADVEDATIQFGAFPNDWTGDKPEAIWTLTSEAGLPPAE